MYKFVNGNYKLVSLCKQRIKSSTSINDDLQNQSPRDNTECDKSDAGFEKALFTF